MKYKESLYVEIGNNLSGKNRKLKITGKREAGFLKGKIEMSADFDKPLEDFEWYKKS